jgi:tetratricopeptide (TPR) repeat protein
VSAAGAIEKRLMWERLEPIIYSVTRFFSRYFEVGMFSGQAQATGRDPQFGTERDLVPGEGVAQGRHSIDPGVAAAGARELDKADDNRQIGKGDEGPSDGPETGAVGAARAARDENGIPNTTTVLLKRWWPWVMTVVVVAVLAYPLVRRSTLSNAARVGSGPPGPSAETLVSPSLPAAGWLSLSLSCYQQQRYVEAIGAADTALRLQPNFPEAYNNLSVYYSSLRLYDLAIAAAQDALRLKPDFDLARNNLQWAMHEKAAAGSR